MTARDVTTTADVTTPDVASSSTTTSTPVAMCPFFNTTALPDVPELLPIPEDELWDMACKLVQNVLGSSHPCIDALVDAHKLTDVAHRMLNINKKIRRKWRASEFHSICELCEKLGLPVDANRNRLIGALFSRRVQRPPSVRMKAKRNTASRYEVVKFVPWLRKICAVLDILATHNVELYNTISDSIMSK